MPKFRKQKGVTLIELMMTMLISSIVVLSMGILLADNLRGWRVMYGRVHSQEADNTYVTRLLFDKAVRKSSSDPNNIGPNIGPSNIILGSPTLTVKYYTDYTQPDPDSTATFTYAGSTLTVSDTTPAGTSTWIVPNVKTTNGCTFKKGGRTIQMVLTLDNPSNPEDNRPQTFTVFSSAYLHSQ